MRTPSTEKGGYFPKITEQGSEPGLELWSPHCKLYFLLIQRGLQIRVPTKSDRQQKCQKLVRHGDYRSALPNRNPMGATLVTLNFQAGFPLGLATCQMLKGHMWLVAILLDSAAIANGREHLKTGEGVSPL